MTASFNHGTEGAYLENDYVGTSAISVSSSTFNSNTSGDGLEATSKGAITINKVTAGYNKGNGALLENNGSGATGAIIISASTFDSNTTGSGLEAGSNGAITLNKVTASSNYNGALLENNGSGDTGAISVSSSVFSFNTDTAGYGLGASSNGAITINKLTASYNKGNGALLQNNGSGATGAFSVSASTFDSNMTGFGLAAQSNSAIMLNKVTASSNYNGALLGNNGTGVTGTISVSSSVFNNNTDTSGDGFGAGSNSTITLNKVTASYNQGNGALLENNGSGNTGTISVSASAFNNNTTGYGLGAQSHGAITLSKVTANANAAAIGGALLDNSFSGATGAISISSSVFNNNTGAIGYGLGAQSNGVITLKKVTATGNFNDGVGVGSSNVVVSCSNISHNDAYGIYALLSGGTLTLNKVALIGNTSGPYFLFSGGIVVPHTHC